MSHANALEVSAGPQFSPVGEFLRENIDGISTIGRLATEVVGRVFHSSRQIGSLLVNGAMEVATSSEDETAEPPIENVRGMSASEAKALRGDPQPATKEYRARRQAEVEAVHLTNDPTKRREAENQRARDRRRGGQPLHPTTGTGDRT